jgi:electron transfer flavoprotein alpha subunit
MLEIKGTGLAEFYTNANEKPELMVFLEQDQGKLDGSSVELLGKGKELATELRYALVGAVLGHNVAHLAEEAIEYGADEVVVADHAHLKEYTTMPYTKAMADIVNSRNPSILLIGATRNGRDLAGRMAVRLKTGLTADVTGLEIETGTNLVIGWVPGFGGGIGAAVKCTTRRPQMITARPGVFPMPPLQKGRKGKVAHFEVKLDGDYSGFKILEKKRAEGIDLTKSKIIIAGGRGTEGDFELLSEVAGLLGGEVGATRVAVDEGWATRDVQIGQTGVVCRPKLCIAAGISGASQFTVGVRDSETIIAINTDENATIFEDSDMCIVGDLKPVLHALVAEMKKDGVHPGKHGSSTEGKATA